MGKVENKKKLENSELVSCCSSSCRFTSASSALKLVIFEFMKENEHVNENSFVCCNG